MSGELSAEDREKAREAIANRLELGLRDPAGYTSDENLLLEAYAALSGGVPARPTREALMNALVGVVVRVGMGAQTYDRELGPVASGHIADALLAADHLWAEQPSEGRASEIPPGAHDALDKLTIRKDMRTQDEIWRVGNDDAYVSLVRYTPHDERASDYALRVIVDRTEDGGSPEKLAAFIRDDEALGRLAAWAERQSDDPLGPEDREAYDEIDREAYDEILARAAARGIGRSTCLPAQPHRVGFLA